MSVKDTYRKRKAELETGTFPTPQARGDSPRESRKTGKNRHVSKNTITKNRARIGMPYDDDYMPTYKMHAPGSK